MRDSNGAVVYNLYAKIVENRVKQMIMPDDDGILNPAQKPYGESWYELSWPVNPHFTGERAITEMIESRFPGRTPIAR